MIRRLLGVLCTVLTCTTVLGAPSAAAIAAHVDFGGTVALSNCSGSVVRLAGSAPDDPALVLSNGHCVEGGFPPPGQVMVDQPSQRTFSLLSRDGRATLGTLHATRLVYATMTGTDTSLYRLDTTYADIQRAYGISALELSATHPTALTPIKVVSGYWKTVYSCSVAGFVPELREGDWAWHDSIRYTPGCKTIGGTSGSPIVDADSGKVIGVNNTGNERGERCTLDNPCEVSDGGQVTVRRGVNYGQQTYLFYGCVGTRGELDLNRPGCALPKPAA